ncbi:FAD-binding protein, partial [bacterium]
QAVIDQVWLKCTDDEGPFGDSFFGATPAPENRHPLPDLSAVNCTPQMGLPGPSYERLPHFRMDFTPSSGEELQSEFLIPRQHAVSAIMEIAAMRDRIAPLLHVSEIRTMAADDLWLSSSYGHSAVGIHFTWLPDWDGVSALLPEIESRLATYGARAHWGKLFLATDRLSEIYERLPDFRRLAEAYDPEGKFRNEFLKRTVFA